MDFHGMKRKDLQTLCKKHGIPGNLKNIEMATRLASAFQKETVKDDVVVSKEAKRVRFSPENEVFEFTRSAQKCQRKNVRMRSQGHAQDFQQGGIELRRSKRIVAKGIKVAGTYKIDSNTRRGGLSDVKKALEVPMRSKRIGSSDSTKKDCKVAELMALEQFEFEDISQGLEKIGRRSTRLKDRTSRLVNIDVQTNTQNRRRSIRLKARAANSSMGGETSDGRPLCSAKEGKKETKTKQSEGSTVVKSQQGKEPLIDCEVYTTENYPMMKVQDLSKVEKIPRCEKSLSELLVDGQALKGDKESKRTSGNDREDKKLPPSSNHTALDNMSNSLNCCSVIDCERDGASVDNVKKPNVYDETQVRVRFTRNSSRHDSFKAPILVEGNLVEKKMDETLEKKQDRSAELGMDIETTSTQENLTPIGLLDQYAQFEQEAAGGTNVASGGSSKKSQTMNQECVKDMSHEMIENSSSSSEAKATESVTVIENVLDSIPEKSVDSSQRTNTQELNSELMEGKREEKLEHDSILMPVIEEDKEEVSSRPLLLIERLSPALVPLAISNPEAELGVPTSHTLVKDIASTVIVEETTKTKEEIFICGPISELKEDSSVAKLGNIEAILENSAECWKEIHPSKDDEKGSLEKKIQAENINGNFSEYNTEDSKVGCINVGHSGNLESLDEVKDDSLGKTEQTISRESGCKLNELELRRWSSSDFTSLSPKEDNVSKCFEEDEIKALSQTLPSNKDVIVFDESDIFTTPERNLMLMEQLSENGKTTAADSVTHDKDEAVESHVVVFTTPRIAEAEKEEDDTITNFPDESDAPNTTERYSMSEGSRRTKARNEGECNVIELHDESDIASSLVRKFSVEDFKGDRTERNKENRSIELQHESGTCTSLDTHELFGSCGQNEARESVQFYEGSGLSTGLHRDQPLSDSELGEAGWQEINSAHKSGLFTNLETQLVSGDSEQKKAVKTGEKADEDFCDESDVPNIPERRPFTENSELDEAAKSEEDKAVELQVDCGIFTSAEKRLLLETGEEMKGDNMTTNSHVVLDVFIASESQYHMGEFEPDEAEKTNRENMNVDLLGESNTYNNPESHLLFGDSGVDETKKIKDHTSATCEESFVFTSPEGQQILVNSEPHSDGKEERNEVEFKDESAYFSKLESGLVLGESGQAGPDFSKSYLSQYQSHHSSTPKFDFRDNTVADSSGSMASKVSYNHEFNVGAELMKKGSQAEDVDSLDATQGKSKKKSGHSPHVDSVNLFDFDIEEAKTIMEAERNVLCGILALPIEGNSQTVGEISSYLEVAGTCSMVSEEFGPCTDVQNQIHDAMEELALTDNTEADELIEAGGSYVSEKTCVLAGAENEHLSLNSEVDFRNTSEKSVPKFLKDEAADSIATAFEKAISVTSDELTVQNNMNEKSADEEMIRRETTPSPEETLHDLSENKEYLNIDESGEKQVSREPILIYRTQVKLKRHDMKENAPNSKIVDKLNVTAPRTSKRQPLQDLRKS